MSDLKPGLLGRLFVALQHVLPQHLLSHLMYRLARVQWPPLRSVLIRTFVRLTGADLSAAVPPGPGGYVHLNALFTRALIPGARPLAAEADAVLSPVDGTVSQIGVIEDGLLVQAKGHSYSVRDLLGDAEAARRFDGGSFATLYLSPKDYHRVHMPVSGDLVEMRHLQGRLFSVNALTASLVPGLFARNERVLCLFDSQAGPLAMVLVGAIFVGGIETRWEGEVRPRASGAGQGRWDYAPGQVRLPSGAEMGRFNLGSTVILLFGPGAVTWAPVLAPGQSVRMGQRIGRQIHRPAEERPA